jgi:ribose transport system permease protein
MEAIRSEPTVRSARKGPSPLQARWTGNNAVAGLVAMVGLAVAVFAVAGKGFLSPFNVNSITQLAAEDVVIGFAQAMVIVLGRMNLAVGGIGAVTGAVSGWLLTATDLPLTAVLLIGVAVGGLAGALIAIVEFRSGLNSFVVTLAFLSIYSGGVLVTTEAVHFRIPVRGFVQFGNGKLGTPYVSPLVVVTLVVAVLLWLFYHRTATGWKSIAVGSNERAARVSGVDVQHVVLVGFIGSGMLCAVAAIMEMARVGEASPGLGSTWMFPSFIAPVLGGVALAGGRMSVGGIVLGALFYDSLSSGLVLVGVPTYWLGLAQGGVLLIALLTVQTGAVGRLRRTALLGARHG